MLVLSPWKKTDIILCIDLFNFVKTGNSINEVIHIMQAHASNPGTLNSPGMDYF